MGAEKVMDTFLGKVPYTDSQWVDVLTAFEEMQKGGFADPSLVTLEVKNSEKRFASERAGMTFNGSWAVNVYSEMNDQLDFAPFRPPALNADNPRPVWGGAGSVFYVNAHSENKDLAIAFLKWFTDKNQASFLLKETRNPPAVKGVDMEGAPILKSFYDLMEESIHPSRFPVTEDVRVTEVFTKGIQSILIAERTPSQVAEEVQKMKNEVKKEKENRS